MLGKILNPISLLRIGTIVCRSIIKDLKTLHDRGFIKVERQGKINCDECTQANLAKQPFYKWCQLRSSRSLELLHTDVCGPIVPETTSGFKYFLIITDDFTRYSKVYLLTQT